jgi:glycerol kinase
MTPTARCVSIISLLLDTAPHEIVSPTLTYPVGITQHTERGHIARATLEAVCFQTKAILDAMEKDSGHKLAELKVDGGMSNSALCMQTQADLVSIPIVRPKMRETTALGAAIAAGFAVEVWKSFDELREVNTAGQTTFEPKMGAKESGRMFKRWERAVTMCKGWLAEYEAEEEELREEEAREDEIEEEKEKAKEEDGGVGVGVKEDVKV